MYVKEYPIVLFGLGKVGNETLQKYKEMQVPVSYLCDNNPEMWGKKIDGLFVIEPQQLRETKEKTIVVIASRKYFDEIKESLAGNPNLYILSIGAFKEALEFCTYGKGKKGASIIKTDIDSVDVSIVIDKHSEYRDNYDRCVRTIAQSVPCFHYEILEYEVGMKVRGNAVIVIQDTSVVYGDSLNQLYSLWNEKKRESVIGSTIVDGFGNIIESGAYVNGKQWCPEGYGAYYTTSEYRFVRKTQLMSPSGMIMTRELFESWQESRENYTSLRDVQVEFAMKLYQKGIGSILHSESFMIDELYASCAAEICVKLEEQFLNRCHEFQGLFRIFQDGEKVALFSDRDIIQFDRNAGGRSSYAYLNAILNCGWKIIYYPMNLEYNREYASVLQQKGILVLYDKKRRQEFTDYMQQIADKLKYAFVNRPQIASFWSQYFKENPHIYVSYYGHDVHHMRLQRQYDLCHEEQMLSKIVEYKEMEMQAVNQVACAGYPSHDEVAYMKGLCPKANLQYYPLYALSVQDEINAIENRKGILFVGGFEHTPNTDGVIWFVQEILPMIRKQGVMDCVYLVGSKPTEAVKKLEREDVIVTGYVSDERLDELYQKCRVAVLPLRFGAGMKGKLLEAMQKGIPVVTTSIGAEGLMNAEGIFGIADIEDDFAREVIRVIQDTDLACQYSKKEQNYIREYFGSDVIEKLLKEQFEKALLGEK